MPRDEQATMPSGDVDLGQSQLVAELLLVAVGGEVGDGHGAQRVRCTGG